ncbi:hypothetical protein FRY74_04740 [Vicingus serpentipes]|uniref:DUF3667 domain-containing protein n=1 Tax=Vicingus serpentipes TaxID=1926625 RepID=A0A5C6RUA5_9FLAO|nr:hypothetical protein [Vicingus serpentipes]TXB65881.1 hypothetical protein FRY74_04740 [Vicingus serpentipes]
MKKCSVCNNTLKGKFCEKCGQKYTAKKLTFSNLFSDLISSLTDVEKNVFLNIYSIVRHPKIVINNFWNGYRNYYYKPGKMLFYFITIAGISSFLLGQTLFGLTFSTDSFFSESFVFAIVFFPILSLSSFLTYRKYKRSFIEHIASTVYLISTFGIIILIIENILIYFSLVKQENLIWIIILITSILFWNSILFTPSKKIAKLFFNFFIELIVLAVIISVLVLIMYFTGAMTLN